MALFVETHGRGADVVMLHGWGLHGGVFHRLAEVLADRYCVHRVDLPGHGASPLIGYFDEAVVDWLDAYFPRAVHVLGWSLGGLISQYWAQRYPAKIKSLALVATSPCFVQRPDWPYAQTTHAIEALAASLNTAFELTLERFLALQMLGAPNARDTLKTVRASVFTHGRPQGLMPALQWLLHADSRSVIKDISCPVGIFHGCRDVITPIAAARWLASRLPCAELYEFRQASHAPFLSDEVAFVQKLTKHLGEHA